MRALSAVGWIVGTVTILVAILLLVGNPEIASPGPQLLPNAAYDVWRFLLGATLWAAAVWFTVAYLAATRQPGAAWLSLLAYVLLFLPYAVVPGLMIDFVSALVCVVVFGLVLPAVVALIGRAIGRAAARRKTAG